MMTINNSHTNLYSGSNLLIYNDLEPLVLECGDVLPRIDIAYHTYGTLNANRDNVVWICHALTANSDVAAWWNPGMIGEGLIFDPAKYFIVCANILGSCYGTTGPLSVNPATQTPYYRDFPMITIRDMVAVHERLRRFLGICRIKMVVGGSIGGFQALEWGIMNPDVFDTLIILACGARATPWVVAQNEAQRMAIEADATFYDDVPDGGQRGLAAARAMALITYRNYTTYNDTQHDPDRCKLSDFRASSYQRHQGDKLVRRFDAYSYHRLTQAMDAFDVSRGRGDDVCKVLKINNICTLVVGISTDVLFPVAEQQWIAAQMPNAVYEEVNSKFGHDGFLIETAQVSRLIAGFSS